MGFLKSSVIVIGMASIAACLALLAFVVGLALDTAAVLAAAAFLVMLIGQFAIQQRMDRRASAKQWEGLGRAIEALAADHARLVERVLVLEVANRGRGRVDVVALRADIDRMRGDLDELVGLLAEQADAVAELMRGAIGAPTRSASPDERPAGRFAALSEPEWADLAREAVEAGRIELLLQPIATLPQRKVRFYEVHARLRTGRGEVMLPDEIARLAREGGLSPALDRAVLHRVVRLARRLKARNRAVGLVMPLSPAFLAAGEEFRDAIELLETDAAITGMLIATVAQDEYRHFGAIELESLTALARCGARLALDEVRDLRLPARELADRGIRFVRIPAGVLLGKEGALPPDIHPADLADLLARSGIDLVATEIDAEATILDLLDYNVRFGQGVLISPPRPIRAEILGEEEQGRVKTATV